MLQPLSTADKAYISAQLSTEAAAPPLRSTSAASAETQERAKSYKFLNKQKKLQLQRSVEAYSKLLGHSHASQLLQDTAATCAASERPQRPKWKRARPTRSHAVLLLGRPSPERAADAEHADTAETPVITEGSAPAAPADPADDDTPEDVDDEGVLLTSVLSALSAAYQETEDAADKKRLLSLVAPYLNIQQGMQLFQCSHHYWESARLHASTAGAFAPVVPPVIHRIRTDTAVSRMLRMLLLVRVMWCCCLTPA